MYRTPARPPRSPGAPRPPGRFPSPGSCWSFPGSRSPFGGPGHRGASPRGGSPFSPGSPAYSPGANRWYRDGSPAGPGGGGRSFGEAPATFGGGRGYRGAAMRRRGDGFRRPHGFSPTSGHGVQPPSSDSVDKYFSPAMLQDPWAALTPTAAGQGAMQQQ